MSSQNGSIQMNSNRVAGPETTVNIQQQLDEPNQSQFECPICMDWLQDPIVTSCGHRFCKKCITSWLKNKNPSCPIDKRYLSNGDLFPDNYTLREIQQIRRPCPNHIHGCPTVTSPLELNGHLALCTFGAPPPMSNDVPAPLECSFKQCGCTYTSINTQRMDEHLKDDMVDHLNLLMISHKSHTSSAADANTSMLAAPLDSNVPAQHAWDAPSKPTTPTNATSVGCSVSSLTTAVVQPNDSALLKALYERIVVLEQQTREKDAQLDRIGQQLARVALLHADSMNSPTVNPRYSAGELVWRITEFQQKIATMSANPNEMFHSGESYTSPHGYRYCVRINSSPKKRDCICLYVHLMQSENDFHLEWPFRGRIKISMIHRNLNETKNDVIMSNPEIMAFHRPSQEVSPRGFGFPEYASISDICKQGYVVDDVLTIKVQLSIV